MTQIYSPLCLDDGKQHAGFGLEARLAESWRHKPLQSVTLRVASAWDVTVVYRVAVKPGILARNML
jgi:hypothetical protein